MVLLLVLESGWGGEEEAKAAGMFSSEVFQSLWGCEVSFMKGMRTESSISSTMALTAGSSSSAAGGEVWFGRLRRWSRTSLGRLTSRGPLGMMYAAMRRCQRRCSWAQSERSGDMGMPAIWEARASYFSL